LPLSFDSGKNGIDEGLFLLIVGLLQQIDFAGSRELLRKALPDGVIDEMNGLLGLRA
jgi:hypothetical protein